jgi:heme-degrading monooxygenase HmoA
MPVMRFSHGKLKPGAWNEYEELYCELASERREVPGLLGSIMARDADDADSGYTVSIWESLEAMRAYEGSDRAAAVAPRFMALYSGDYSTTISEMRLWDVRATGAGGEWPGGVHSARAA